MSRIHDIIRFLADNKKHNQNMMLVIRIAYFDNWYSANQQHSSKIMSESLSSTTTSVQDPCEVVHENAVDEIRVTLIARRANVSIHQKCRPTVSNLINRIRVIGVFVEFFAELFSNELYLASTDASLAFLFFPPYFIIYAHMQCKMRDFF